MKEGLLNSAKLISFLFLLTAVSTNIVFVHAEIIANMAVDRSMSNARDTEIVDWNVEDEMEVKELYVLEKKKPRRKLRKNKSGCGLESCPTDDSYPLTCLESAIPPWPLCQLLTVDEWVKEAQYRASRCCGDDLLKCNCPPKNCDDFFDNLDQWCDGISTCSD